MRGNPAEAGRRLVGEGTIPADAGEPHATASGQMAHRDYPRGCGGTVPRVAARIAVVGLSPRMRGNRVALGQADAAQGTIPADAGEPRSPAASPSTSGDYPRGCGGTDRFAGCYGLKEGLSPRMRGNLSAMSARKGRWGTIPADAGEPS